MSGYLSKALGWLKGHQDILGIILLVIILLGFQVGVRVALGTPNPFYVVASGSMEPTLHGGPFWVLPDIVVVEGRGRITYQDLRVGDIIVFCQPRPRLEPCPQDYDRVIVHRIIRIDGGGIRTKGDNNGLPDAWVVREEDILGRVVFVVKGLGFFTFITERGPLFPYPLNLIFGLALILLIVQRSLRERREAGEPREGDTKLGGPTTPPPESEAPNTG
jgi:signal peptidase